MTGDAAKGPGAVREAAGRPPDRFSKHLWQMACCVGALAITFALSVRAEREISRAHALRFRTIQLADELRHSGDDLTRMARTYVVTGDAAYKRHFQEILDIRDGRKPRPENYSRPYWDLVLKDGPPRGSEQAVPLLDLMRQAGFTEPEFRKLAEAKANSDGLTIPELEAMTLVESTGPAAEANRARARRMMYDDDYHRAKAAVMGAIADVSGLVDRRTSAAVSAAENSAVILRSLLAAFGLALTLVLWRGYVALSDTLGGSVDEVWAHIAGIGSGNFSASIRVKAGLENSVLGWLAETQARLLDAAGERTRAETGLRESEERFRATFEQAAAGVALVAPDGRWLRVNEKLCEIVGYTQEELLLLTFQDITHPDDLDSDLTRMGEMLAGEIRTYTMEKRYFRKGGSIVWIDLTVSLVREASGQPKYFIAIVQDISARKQAEAEIRRLNTDLEERIHERTAANRELEAFSYSVSHDLRAPLRAIDGYGRILLEDYESRLDSEGRRLLAVISSETRRMGQLIDDLLSFARLGRQKLEFSALDMEALARAAFDEQAARLSGRSLQLKMKPLPPARGDRATIRVVLENLISNAIKYTKPRDSAVIEIGSRPEDGQASYYVKDNGVGFDMAYANKLFGVFQRLHTTEEFEGTGVGLALVQRIIQRHGGRVWGNAAVDEGATFSFTLPGRGEES